MASLAPSQSITTDAAHAQLHFTISGFWQREAMDAFLVDLAKAAMVFIKQGTRFSALGDLSEFVPQDQETAGAIRDSLLQARQHGLTRFAVVSTSSLVRMQYRRITEGLEVEFFDDVASAKEWLRA